jgi:endonuclease III
VLRVKWVEVVAPNKHLAGLAPAAQPVWDMLWQPVWDGMYPLSASTSALAVASKSSRGSTDVLIREGSDSTPAVASKPAVAAAAQKSGSLPPLDLHLGWFGPMRSVLMQISLQEEDFFTAASVAAMEEDEVAMIIKAAGLKAGTSQDFRSALGALKQQGEEGEKPPSHEEAAAIAGAGAAASMKLRLQTVLGKSVVIAVNPKDTVLSVLRVAAEAGLVDGGKTYGLMYGKVAMDLSKTMKDHGVVDGAEMTVTPNTMGSI